MLNKGEYSKRLVEYTCSLTYNDLNKEVVEKAKNCILDFIGCAIAATDEVHARIILDVIQELNGKRESTMIGFWDKTSCLFASLLNGSMGHMCELDDTHRTTMSHPGNVIVSAALAMGEKEKATGKDLIVAVTAAYETSLRIGESVSPSHYLKGWCEAWLTFGSAMAAGKILKLNEAQMENALNLAGIQAAGVTGWHLSAREYPVMAKDFRPGYQSADGVLSALLAKRGFTSHARFVENFGKLYSDNSNLEKVVEGLGETYKILEVSHKPYSACRYAHSAIDAILELRQSYGVSADDVDKIIVKGHKFINGLNKPEPINSLQSRFSIQFQVALTLVEGEEGILNVLRSPSSYPEKKLQDPKIREIMRRVEVVCDKNLDKEWPNRWPSIVEIITTDGKRYSTRVDYPKGEPENPLTSIELRKKFRMISAPKIGEEKTDKIINMIDRLEMIDDVSKILYGS